MSRVATGLDQTIADGWHRFKGLTIGIVCHQASVSSNLTHVIDEAMRAGVKVGAVFGPQHGPWGHTQDNMIEWEGYTDPRTGLTFYSLYGSNRKPTQESLQGLQHLVIDLQDVGARYYTFIWTTALCLEACAEAGIPVTILDRPNPIDGVTREGPGHDMEFRSFVGLYSLPVRHGLTIGEIASHINERYLGEACDLRVVHTHGWERWERFDQTGLPWVLPSPNMPTPATALVYPGQCLLEGTNLSEGRGTTQPFETFGAPYLDGWALALELNALNLPGCSFRPVFFQPTFQKHAGAACGGCFIHVTDAGVFEPVFTTVAVLHTVRKVAGEQFAWNPPPYEYEQVKLPIDILVGSSWIREAVDSQTSLEHVRERMAQECHHFEPLLRS